jgi:hypothetical protein
MTTKSAPLPRATGERGRPWGKLHKSGDWYLFGTDTYSGSLPLVLLVNPTLGSWTAVAVPFYDYLHREDLTRVTSEGNTIVFVQDQDGIVQLYTLEVPMGL